VLPHLKQSSPETVVHMTAQRFPLDTVKDHIGTARELQTGLRPRKQHRGSITIWKSRVPHPCAFFLAHGWETTNPMARKRRLAHRR
jgi:hypothetical protein